MLIPIDQPLDKVEDLTPDTQCGLFFAAFPLSLGSMPTRHNFTTEA